MDEPLSLQELWRAALAQPMHGAACGCSGAAAPTVVDAPMLELHLLDFLEDRHGLQGHRIWSDAVAQRTASPSGSFVRWLEGLTGLDPALHRQLLVDTATVLENMLTHARGRLRPVGTQQRGWLTPG
jgi:hypothetical protein